ncbi:MAG: hypothetical protein P4L03_02550 [Terracidiphilus sp.]|nr:hypothetical protein [Terracidiphilus sp.]
MNRREFAVHAAAAALLPTVLRSRAYASDAEVPTLNTSSIHPADFADSDLDIPFALSHFARLANSVLMDGPDRGFISLSVWRGTAQLHPYNARIMESILTLAWFYTAPQKWNPYRGNPALRARLEAALTFWCNLQSADGKFSEYGPQQWNLAATSFAVKFISEALRLLKSGPPIDPALHQRAVDCCRKAVHAVLFDPDLIKHGLTYSNQYTNIFAGGPAFLDLYPDAVLSARLDEKFKASSVELQSPCGYMYEKDGPDLGYTLNTHHENVRMAWHYWRNTPRAAQLIEEERRFCEWLGFNALPEPGQDFFVLNRGIETRQQHAIYAHLDTPVAERCPIARAFAAPPELRAARIRAQREKLEKQWPQVDPLPVGQFEALGPYRFLQRAHYDWHPTAEQIEEAKKLVRPLAERSFVEQRKDTREPIAFTYIRRPGYYAAFAAAPKPISEQQRLGLTFVWTPSFGVLLQSQTSGKETAWGTSDGAPLPFEAAGLAAEYLDGNAQIHYPLAGGGLKRIVFAEDRIRISIERPGAIVERVPVFDPGCVVSQAAASIHAQPSSPVPGKNFSVVELKAEGKLEYEIRPSARG